MTKATDQVEAAAQVLGAELVPLSALLSLPSGFYDGRWIESDTLAALVDECVRMAPPQTQPADALDWAVQRWNDEVRNRPLVNIHRRSLDDTWRQVITYLGGDAEKLIGPSHDDLLAAAQEGGNAAKEA